MSLSAPYPGRPGLWTESKRWLTRTCVTTTNRQEGVHAFYKGITPRVMRVAPGQAVTFTVYEYLKDKLEKSGPAAVTGERYEE